MAYRPDSVHAVTGALHALLCDMVIRAVEAQSAAPLREIAAALRRRDAENGESILRAKDELAAWQAAHRAAVGPELPAAVAAAETQAGVPSFNACTFNALGALSPPAFHVLESLPVVRLHPCSEESRIQHDSVDDDHRLGAALQGRGSVEAGLGRVPQECPRACMYGLPCVTCPTWWGGGGARGQGGSCSL